MRMIPTHSEGGSRPALTESDGRPFILSGLVRNFLWRLQKEPLLDPSARGSGREYE